MEELMAREILPEELWTLIEPLLPADKPPKSNGRPAVANRDALTGILFVLRTGIPWEYLPQEMGCGCGMTCWRRLRDWQKLGVWQAVFEKLLAHLNKADRIDWSRAVVDSSSVRAVFGGSKPAPIQRIAAKPGASTTSSPMARESHLPSPSPALTATM
jgi:transposase